MAGVKKNNYFITFILVAMFFGLLFLPEMLGLGTSPATKIKESLSFDFNNLIPKKNELGAKNVGSVRPTQKSESIVIANNRKVVRESINWANLRDRKTKNHLNKIKSSSLKFAKRLPTHMHNSKFSLYNYAGGIDFVMTKGTDVMTGDAAAKHLENLDIAVTNALIEEKANRFILNEWSKIALSKKLSKSATKIKKKAVPPFNPRVIFKEIRLIRFLSPRNGYNLKKGQVAAWPEIYYKGDDVVRFLDIYQNGNKIKTVIVNDNKDKLIKTDWYSAKLPMIRNGIMTIVFKSKDGKRKIKSYKFFGNLSQFKWRENREDKYLEAIHKYRRSSRDKMIEASLKYSASGDVTPVGNLVNNSQAKGNLFTKKSNYTSF